VSSACLVQELIPQVKGEIFVDTGKVDSKMFLECADCPFSCIAMMNSRGQPPTENR